MIFLLFPAFSDLSAKAQSGIDSLKIALGQNPADTQKVNLLNKLSKKYNAINVDTAILYAQQALTKAQKIKFKKGEMQAYDNLGYAQFYKGLSKESLETYQKEYEISSQYKDTHYMALALANLGFSYVEQGNFPVALDYYLRAVKLKEELKDSASLATTILNIGVLHYNQKKYDLALKYQKDALKILLKCGTKAQIANAYARIGNTYMELKNDKDALTCYFTSLKLFQEAQSQRGIAIIYNNVAGIYQAQEKHELALSYYKKALEIRREIGDKNGCIIILGNMGRLYSSLNQYKQAENALKESIEMAKAIGYKEMLKDDYEALANLYAKQNDYKNAFKFHKLFFRIHDSIFNEHSSDQVAEMEAKYESDKKENAIKLLNKDKALQQTEILAHQNKQKSLIGIVALICILMSVLALAFRNKQKANQLITKEKAEVERQRQLVVTANEELHQQNEEIAAQRDLIEQQKGLVEEKQREILDSIHYAKSIQQAMLTSEEYIRRHLPDFFIYYQPKDIVSGDFYWGTYHKGSFYLATADCTGHGVPGAFMSLLNISFLNENIVERGFSDPSQILNNQRTEIINALNANKEKLSTGTFVKDGMDCVLCKFDLTNLTLTYAAANNPLWLVRSEGMHDKNVPYFQLREFAADKMPVGKYHDDMREFSQQSIPLQKGDVLYTFTDGFADQFGGKKGKKYKYKKLQETILSIAHMPMEDQKKILTKEFEDWKGNNEQVDDVLVIGVKI